MEFVLEDAERLLARTPALLDGWLRGLPETWTEAREGAGSWSPREVLGHLIHGEDTDWIPRARLILEHGAGLAFEPFDRLAQVRRFAGVSLAQLLDQFAARRAASLATLHGWHLTKEQLALPGLHPELGPVTLEQLLATWVTHDLTHIVQIARVMAKCYDAEVGPWKAYIGVLARG